MQKINSQDVKSLLKTAGAAIRSLKKENGVLNTKLAARQREDRVVKIARDMEEKGLSTDMDFEEKVASVRNAKNLDVTEEAVKMAAPQGRRIGGLGEVDSPGSASALESYIMTGEDPSE